MTRTGIFFTYFQGERLRDFPQALAGILDKDNVTYYDAVYEVRDGLNYLSPLSEELLLRVHWTERHKGLAPCTISTHGPFHRHLGVSFRHSHPHSAVIVSVPDSPLRG